MMAVINDLFDTPPADIASELRSLRAERSMIEGKEQMLERLLEMRAQQSPELAEEIEALGVLNAVGPLREQIKQVLAARAGAGEVLMVPRDVLTDLVSRGNRTATLDSVRVTMKRMADADELLRPEPDAVLYGLPEVQGTVEALQGYQTFVRQQAQRLLAAEGQTG